MNPQCLADFLAKKIKKNQKKHLKKGIFQ